MMTLIQAIKCKCTKESETVTCVEGACEVDGGCEFTLFEFSNFTPLFFTKRDSRLFLHYGFSSARAS